MFAAVRMPVQLYRLPLLESASGISNMSFWEVLVQVERGLHAYKVLAQNVAQWQNTSCFFPNYAKNSSPRTSPP